MSQRVTEKIRQIAPGSQRVTEKDRRIWPASRHVTEKDRMIWPLSQLVTEKARQIPSVTQLVTEIVVIHLKNDISSQKLTLARLIKTYKHFHKMSIFVLQNISGENLPFLELLGSKD